MYPHEQHLSVSPSSPSQLQESQALIEQNDIVQRVGDSVDDHYQHNHHHHHHGQHRCSDDGPVAFEGDSIYAVDNYGRVEGSDQLTLSFRGQVYVFDSVTPDKVEAVLLVLGGNVGGSAPTPASQGAEASHVAHMSQQDMMVYPGRSSLPQREASLNRYRRKRNERTFDKLIRYNVRQEVAQRQPRSKGQFTSSKKGGESSGCNAQDSGPDETQLETSCTHCGISSLSTPMMRRGPNGPRTLCNACGLVWGNKRTLRDLSKKQDPYVMPNELTGASPFRATDILGEAKYVNFGENDSPALIAQH
ncbi:hypothetical protein SOVF_099700 [Spinacia oleracea]|uniref:GATA transcription factor 25 isoform X2 n=1 Tax=Spinacia oleracea TaxID=3562 RepID=A0A9R0ISP3_SPIOL|nr:GATA transcription factor 25 isoform X2 [Spinacia oleracea]KNA15283.1 hypothetical protein SOVF_099700 [Spinacia oleracea]